MPALAPHLRGHVLLFDGRPAPAYAAQAGLRILVAVAVLEGLVGPRFHLLDWLGFAQPNAMVRVALLLLAALALAKYFARVAFGDLGLRAWREWSLTEKSYFVQVAIAANVVFALLFADRLRTAPLSPALTLLGVNFAWGFYQELVYRGLLQTELVRRFGAIAGVLAANLLFTFGPLHFYHFSRANPWPMLAAIFAMGLFFGALYHRSRNLWLPAVFHGIGMAWILATLD